ncbi:MAG TPA: lipocalin-like domain-containing protein, partial [Aggregatilineales bacterium]|nr:lipocalin-like domain-containing protein [Aggregatilineales bacterium]
MNWKRIGVGIVIGAVILGALIGVMRSQGTSGATYSADVVAALDSGNIAGFARAYQVRDFKFPQDYGAHPDFQTEWWYYTGNLADSAGRLFGFELTIFRRAVAPALPERQSDWATNQIYFADFALSDIADSRFYTKQRFSRGAAGLAGAEVDPRVHIWINDWSMTAQDAAASVMRLKAADDPIAIDLTTTQTKPPTLEGDRGLSAKSTEPGNASYYYSLTHLLTQGTLTVSGTTFTVTGTTWMDHEFSTSVLGKDAAGWDWFALKLDDDRELMLYRIRHRDGGVDVTSNGTLVNADGTYTHLALSDFTIESPEHWTSPKTGAVYPSRWKVTVKVPGETLQL